MNKRNLVFLIICTLIIGGIFTLILGLFLLNDYVAFFGGISAILGYIMTFWYEELIKDMKTEFKPFDVVIYKPTGERGLVKRVTENGVFVLFRIQSTANLCKFEDLELE